MLFILNIFPRFRLKKYVYFVYITKLSISSDVVKNVAKISADIYFIGLKYTSVFPSTPDCRRGQPGSLCALSFHVILDHFRVAIFCEYKSAVRRCQMLAKRCLGKTNHIFIQCPYKCVSFYIYIILSEAI